MTSTQEIVDIIEKALRPDESVRYAFLFGSAVSGLRRESDIDVLVGGDFDFDRRLTLSAALSTGLKRSVDLVPEKETRSQLVLKAMSQGILIFTKDWKALKQDYLRHWRACDDATTLTRMRIERIKREYGYGG